MASFLYWKENGYTYVYPLIQTIYFEDCINIGIKRSSENSNLFYTDERVYEDLKKTLPEQEASDKEREMIQKLESDDVSESTLEELLDFPKLWYQGPGDKTYLEMLFDAKNTKLMSKALNVSEEFVKQKLSVGGTFWGRIDMKTSFRDTVVELFSVDSMDEVSNDDILIIKHLMASNPSSLTTIINECYKKCQSTDSESWVPFKWIVSGRNIDSLKVMKYAEKLKPFIESKLITESYRKRVGEVLLSSLVNGRYEIFFLENFIIPQDLNVPDSQGYTVLDRCLINNDYHTLIPKLLENGAMFSKSKKGLGAALVSILEQNPQDLDLAIRTLEAMKLDGIGYTSSQLNVPYGIQYPDDLGSVEHNHLLLVYAFERNSYELFKTLVDKGADPGVEAGDMRLSEIMKNATFSKDDYTSGAMGALKSLMSGVKIDERIKNLYERETVF